MTPTYNILQERVIRDLSGGEIPSDSPWDPDYVIEHIKDAFAEVVKLEELQRRSGDEDDKGGVTQVIATYPDVQVQYDSTTNRCFITFPDNFMSLKHNRGIHAISTMKKSHHRMIREKNPGVTSHLPHATYESSNYGYYVEGLKAFWRRNIIQDGISKVLVKLKIANPNTIGIDDPLPILQEQVAMIIDRVKLRLQNKPIQDRLNDNNPNLRATNEQQH